MNGLEIEWKHLTEVLQDYAEYFIEEARKNLNEHNSNASWKLSDTMKPFIEIGDDEFSVKINIQHYWYYVENGAKGKVTSPAGAKCKAHRPPVPAIKEWIKVKGISKGSDKADLGFAIAISKSIEKRGIPPKHFFSDAKKTTKEAFEERIVEAVRKDIDSYVENVLLFYARLLGL